MDKDKQQEAQAAQGATMAGMAGTQAGLPPVERRELLGAESWDGRLA